MKKNIFLIITFAIVLILLLILLVSKKAFSVIELSRSELSDKITTSGASLLYTKKLNKNIKEKIESTAQRLFENYRKERALLTSHLK